MIYLLLAGGSGLLLGLVLAYLRFSKQLAASSRQSALEADRRIDVEKGLILAEEKQQQSVQSLQLTGDKLRQLEQRAAELERSLVARDSEIRHLQQRIEEEKTQARQVQEQMRQDFENLSNKILKQQTNEFRESAQSGLRTMLDPLRERIQQFEKKVEETYEKGLKDQSDLKAELKKIYDLSVSLDKDARDLTRALRADSKKQGNWGEVVLERVLERSGLIRNQEFYMQYAAQSDAGSTLRPDVVVRLPEEKHLIIDAKVSLSAYTAFVAAEEEEVRKQHLKAHLDSVRRHVKELGEKRYDQITGLNSPEFVLMFMPVEPAFALAVQNDQDLFNDAWNMRVVIVSPTTLLATLRTVASIWKFEKQNQNALEIAKRGGKLYDKLEGFVKDLENVGGYLEKAGRSYEEAHKKLTSGHGNLIRQAEQLKAMGLETKKSLPDHLIQQLDDE